MKLGGRRENDDMKFGWEEGCIIILDKTLVFPRFLLWEIWLKLISAILYLPSDYFWIINLDFTFVLLNVTAAVQGGYLEFWVALAVSSKFVLHKVVVQYSCVYDFIHVTEAILTERLQEHCAVAQN